MALARTTGVQIKSNGTDVSSAIDPGSFDLTKVLTKEVSSLKFNVKNPGGTVPGGGTKYKPAVGQVIDVYETYLDTDGVTTVVKHQFGGTITDVDTVVDGGLVLTSLCTATDWGYTMDGKLVAKSYANMDPADIVADIVTNYCPAGFDATTYVQRVGYTLKSIKFNYEQPTKCLQALASQIGWDWNVDPDKNVHFFLSESRSAPFAIDDTSGAIDWPTLSVDVNVQNMKNSVFVIGGVYESPVTASTTPDSYLADGVQSTWGIRYNYTPATITITKNGVILAIGLANQVTNPLLYGVIYDASNRLITFPVTPDDGDIIKVYGTAEIPIIGHAIDQAAISTFGEFQDAIFDSQIKSITEAQQRAQADILQYGHSVYDVKFYTTTPGLDVGQTIIFNSAKFGISNYPLTIKRIEGVGFTPSRLRWLVECIGSDKVTFVDIMTTLLQKENVDGTTDTDNTTLEVLLAISESMAITDTAAIINTHASSSYDYDATDAVWGFATWS